MVLLLVGAVVVVVGLVVFWVEPLGVLGVLERLTPNIVYRVRTKVPLVALSFDDGPHPEFTPQVLEILKRQEIHPAESAGWRDAANRRLALPGQSAQSEIHPAETAEWRRVALSG